MTTPGRRPPATPAVNEPAGPLLLRRLLEGSLWAGVSTVFGQGSTLVANVAAARLLSREAFGAYAGALGMVQLGSTVLLLGLSYTAAKYVAELRETERERAGRVLGTCLTLVWAIGLAGGVGLVLGGSSIAARVFGRPEMARLLRLAAPALALGPGNLCITSILAGLSSFRSIGRLGIWSGVSYLVLVLAGLLVGGEAGGVVGMAAAAAVQAGLGMGFLMLESKRQRVPLRLGLADVDRSIWVRFGLPGALSSLTAAPAIWSIQAAIIRQPNGLTELGGYLAASNLMVAVLLLPNIVNSVGAAMLNERRGAGDAGGFQRLFRDNVRVTVLSVLGGLAVVGFGGPLLLTIFGRGFRGSYPVLLILLAATLPEGLTISLNQLLQARAKLWYALLAINLPRDTLMPVLAWVLAPAYGAVGGALAYLIGRLVAFVAMLVLVRTLRITHVDSIAPG